MLLFTVSLSQGHTLAYLLFPVDKWQSDIFKTNNLVHPISSPADSSWLEPVALGCSSRMRQSDAEALKKWLVFPVPFGDRKQKDQGPTQTKMAPFNFLYSNPKTI